MVGDQRGGGLLRRERVATGERDPDRLDVEQLPNLLVLVLLRNCRVAPRVAPALPGLEPEVGAHLLVQPLGRPFGCLYRQAGDEQLLAVLALVLELLAEG